MFRKEFRFDVNPIPPFNFGLTMKKPAGWSLFNSGEILEGDTFWTATRLLGTLSGIRMKFKGTVNDPSISVSVFSENEISRARREVISAHLKRMIGGDQDLRDFYTIASKDEILKHTVEDLYGMHDTQSSYLFNSVVLGICLQMARLDRSLKMMENINAHHGDVVEFDGKSIRVEPAAERIAVLDEKSFAKQCNLGYRARFLIGSAKAITEGFPTSDEIFSMAPAEAKKKLMELPGVGDYAADIINPHGGFPIDAWSVDVFGLLFLGKEPKNARDTIERVKRIGTKRWRKWAWMGFFYVAQDLDNLSKQLGIKLRLT